MTYYTSIGHGIWNTEEYLEIFQGFPEIEGRTGTDHETEHRRENGLQTSTRD
jgi:hypothetical protein